MHYWRAGLGLGCSCCFCRRPQHDACRDTYSRVVVLLVVLSGMLWWHLQMWPCRAWTTAVYVLSLTQFYLCWWWQWWGMTAVMGTVTLGMMRPERKPFLRSVWEQYHQYLLLSFLRTPPLTIWHTCWWTCFSVFPFLASLPCWCLAAVPSSRAPVSVSVKPVTVLALTAHGLRMDWGAVHCTAIPLSVALCYSPQGAYISTPEDHEQSPRNLACGPFWTSLRCGPWWFREQTHVLVHTWGQCPNLVSQGHLENTCPGNLPRALLPLLSRWSERPPGKGWVPDVLESQESLPRKDQLLSTVRTKEGQCCAQRCQNRRLN